ncbi:QacE family quaternary ammonium compound efflux SMR transporter [Sphingomonas histidinilytica]|jgi:small multidrug resistance pump|uniref:DMT family transporter n=1 Tax=Rhizorhabdus histidinilytica TaxID=439228 RepID=UPI000F7AAE62|nr:multidrug efflux SMR transporter [Rhizorhabdus histidinilytica]MBO9379316.1 QacE family quaternary ammonium compound efflux SMR transporter [Rhizorhabdus histidinilytica]QEH80617.1 multidrug efflux SMR transporter [Sphingomonas sp. C8-2]
MAYLYLAIAIVAEVIGTTALKLSDGFTRPLASIATMLGYGVAFFCLSLTLRTMPTGVAYAIWSGVGLVLITGVAWLFQGQKLDMAALVGMALIVAGVAVLNLFSTSISS